MEALAPTTRLTPIKAAVAFPAAVLLLVAVFAPFPPGRFPMLRGFFDFAHFWLPVFGCWFLWSRMRWAGWAAFTTMIVLAALCEVIQGFTGRCPSSIDFLRGFVGATVAFVCLWAWRPSATIAHRLGALTIALALSAWPISEFVRVAVHLYH